MHLTHFHIHGHTEYEIFLYVTHPLNPLPREDDLLSLRLNSEGIKFFRVIEKMVVEILDHLCKFLTVNDETDVHE